MIGWHICLFSLFKSMNKHGHKGLSHCSDNLVGFIVIIC